MALRFLGSDEKKKQLSTIHEVKREQNFNLVQTEINSCFKCSPIQISIEKPFRVKEHSSLGASSFSSGVHIPSVRWDSQCRKEEMREGKREKEGGTETRDSELIDYTVLKWSASQPCKYVTNDSARSIDFKPVLWKQSQWPRRHVEFGTLKTVLGCTSKTNKQTKINYFVHLSQNKHLQIIAGSEINKGSMTKPPQKFEMWQQRSR